ncbi:hypothetical protein WUBG_09027 [Wuchereria bancrofti]|uniref:Very-long-chain (3R)-3-hydroxyacyl-CoA dehydratase n=1 Tax=Wuchereria bancrofti TaxID=6293 RepID=J9AZQ6_WUCBA|nr:hypothetical protein WUBG_09027 [Wuchereria bancrofti]
MDAITQRILDECRTKPKTKTDFINDAYYNSFWQSNANIIKIVTALQLIDVAHALVGYTKGNYRIGLIQHSYTLLMAVQMCKVHRQLFILIFAYFSIEIFRYPYYAASCLKIEIPLLTWLRYNAWVLLYPVGLLLEGVTMYRSIPYYYQTGKYSIKLPNATNIGFNFSFTLSIFFLFVFPFGTFSWALIIIIQKKLYLLPNC